MPNYEQSGSPSMDGQPEYPDTAPPVDRPTDASGLRSGLQERFGDYPPQPLDLAADQMHRTMHEVTRPPVNPPETLPYLRARLAKLMAELSSEEDLDSRRRLK